MNEDSRKRQLREWLRKNIEGKDSVSLPDLTHEAIEFFSEKSVFVRGLMEEEFRPAVYEITQRLLAETRGEPVVELGDEVVTRSEFEKRAGSRFEKWMEHAGGRHVRFMKMHREDLILARSENIERAEPFLNRVELIDRVLPRLGTAQIVEDVFTSAELEEMYERIVRRRRENRTGEEDAA